MGGVQPISSASVLDVNDDGVEEIFLTYWLSSQQWLSGWDLSGVVLPGFPKLLYSPSDLNSHCSTHVTDADGDGDLELATGGADFSFGRVHVFGVDGSTIGEATRMDWPKIRRTSGMMAATRWLIPRRFRSWRHRRGRSGSIPIRWDEARTWNSARPAVVRGH